MRAPTWLPTTVRRPLRVARRWWHAGARHGRRVAAVAHHAWRSSLQLRVVTTTLLASSLVVGASGLFVASHSAEILLSRAEDDAEARLASKVTYARAQLT